MNSTSIGLNTAGLLVIVFAIGLAGAFIWTTISRENISQETANTEEKESSTVEPDSETADWKTESIEKYGISFKHPAEDGWAPTFGIVDSLLPGHEATVGVNYTKCGPNCGYALSIAVLYKEFEAGSQRDFGDERMKDNSLYTLSSKETVTIDDVSGTRWEYTTGDNTATAVIFYYFSNDAFSYMFTVNNNGAITDEVDLTAMGEKIVSTVQFLD